MSGSARINDAERDVLVFAYGSNMARQRIAVRAPSARPLGIGCVRGRRLAFHKIGRDGSGKADAVCTGNTGDHVWGVLLVMNRVDKLNLDRCEHRYLQQTALVQTADQTQSAIIYSASEDAIDPTLKPYCWYHRFVMEGAAQHGLPADYRQMIASFGTVIDPDRERHQRNTSLLITPPSPARVDRPVGRANRRASE